MSKFDERKAQFELSLINEPIDFEVAPVVVEPVDALGKAKRRWREAKLIEGRGKDGGTEPNNS